MKMLAALIAGLLLSMTTFVAGLMIAVSFFNAGEPNRLDGKQTAALWSNAPVKIDRTAQDFERLPARVVPKAQTVAALNQDSTGAKASLESTPSEARQNDDPDIDPVVTGAIDRAAETDREQDSWRNSAHIDWCSHRYRSYDAQTNTYRPYGGGSRDCESPFSDVAAVGPTDDAAWQEQSAVDPEQADMQQATYSENTEILSDADHIQSCMARYRSYRPDDNSYQPFDGGPRRQCE